MTTVTEQFYTLNDGYHIPKLGLGTWLIEKNADAARAVSDAIHAGYRHIDTAEAYGNEEGVGAGIRASGTKREDIFVTTKLASDIKDYDGACAAIDMSLEKLGTGYIDLMIIHCPQPWRYFRQDKRSYDAGNREAWRALGKAKKDGKILSIGLSNFEEEDIENILSVSETVPAVNQILTHIGDTPSDLISYCEKAGILIEAYSPLGHGNIMSRPEIVSYAGKYGVTPAQLCIRYTLQLGAVSLPKTVSAERMRENADVDFEISAEDMEKLRAMSFAG